MASALAAKAQGRITEVLSRIALMTGAGYGPSDIASRLWMDMGVNLKEEAIQMIQLELGIRRGPVSETFALKVSLVPIVGFAAAEGVVEDLMKDPFKQGFLQGKAGHGEAILAVLAKQARPLRTVFERGLKLWALAASARKLYPAEIHQIALQLKIDQAKLLELCPELEVDKDATFGVAKPIRPAQRRGPFGARTTGSGRRAG